MLNDLKVATWNVHGISDCMRVALQDDYDILFLQEPWRDKKQEPYGPVSGPYHKIYNDDQCVAYVSKSLPAA